MHRAHPRRAARFAPALAGLALGAGLLGATLAWAAAPTFYGIVTESVVRKVAAVSARVLRDNPTDDAWGRLKKPWFWGEEFNFVSWFSRATAYTEYPGLGKDYHAEAKASLYNRVYRTVRDHLNDPRNLRQAYRRYKPLVLAEVKRNDAVAPLRKKLRRVLAIFQGRLPALNSPEFQADLDAARRLEAGASACYDDKGVYSICRPLYKEAWAAFAAMYRRHGLFESDLRLYEWIARRRAQGGEKLVRAWIAITREFLQSL